MDRSLGKKIDGNDNMYKFVLAGKAWFALKSTKTDKVYQFRVTGAKGKRKSRAWWVEVREPAVGEGMKSPYQYIGGLYKYNNLKPRFCKTKDKARFNVVPVEAFEKHMEVFAWFWNKVTNDFLTPSLEFYHIGKCARCGHKLTDEKSIGRGFGPNCYKIVNPT